ncbi:MAG: leucine-rich repeat domain-containing protein [Eubacteriales bacterium]
MKNTEKTAGNTSGAAKVSKKNSANKNNDSEKIRHNYFRTFFYSFAITFIIVGIAAVLLFIYEHDRNFFGFADKYYEKAIQCENTDDADGAITALRKCLDVDANYSKARIKLIEHYLDIKDYDSAMELTDEGIERHPRNEKYYELKISILTKKNDIGTAMEFVDSISSNYIIVKLTEVRPSNIISTPDPGTYDSALTVRFNVQPNTDVYYTTDGSQPTLQSMRYSPDSPIVIEKGSKTVRAFAINAEGLISDLFSATYRIYSDYTPYTFVDQKIEQIVRTTLGKATGTIYYRDLANLKRLSNEQKGGTSYIGDIVTLEDLAEMPNLTEIRIENEPHITDYTPLLQLKNLTALSVSGNNIDDTLAKQIFSIHWLTSLNISDNLISDLSEVKNIAALRELHIAGNALKDTALENLTGLTNLRTLDISNNLISDISQLSALTMLTSLDISKNVIEDISPVSAMSLLTQLNISSNNISSLDAISRMTKIQTLDISDNIAITSLSALDGYTALTNLKISGTDIRSLVTIEPMTALVTLDCSRTGIRDFSPVVSSQIKNLTAAQCDLTDISSLCYAKELEVLDISVNSIADVTSLVTLPSLKILNISSNPVANITQLTLCPSLESVNCTYVALMTSEIQALHGRGITLIQ